MKLMGLMKHLLEIMKDGYRRSPLRMGLFSFCLAGLIAMSLWDHHAPLPIHGWTAKSLREIQIDNPDDFSFAVFGDNKNGFRTFTRVLRRVNSDHHLAFALDVGDLVFDGNKERYEHFYHQVKTNFRLPLLTAIGNHELREQGRGRYYEMFGPYYYSFRVANSHFIVLDDANGTGLDPWQKVWLEEELRKAQEDKNRFVFLHVPLYDPRGGNSHHCLPEREARFLISLFRKYRVTHIFAGHIHGYFTGRWGGIPYTITGGAGAELLGTDPQHYFYHFLKVRVKKRRVLVRVEHIPSPDFERIERLSLAGWNYLYGFLRFNGIVLAIFLLMGKLLILVLSNKSSQ